MSTETHQVERLHHPYSPSTLQSREACCHYAPHSTTTEAALAGTAQHDSVEAGAPHEKLSDSQADAVNQCLMFFDGLVAQHPGCTTYTEAYLPVDDEVIVTGSKPPKAWKGTTAGYVDKALITADRKAGIIVDWKFGMWEVEDADNNLQGISYALGLFHLCPTLESVTTYFIQPHLDSIDSHTFTRAQVPKLLLRVKTVVARAMQPVTPPNPNELACLFCGNLHKCPAVAELVLNVSKKYRPLEVPANVTPELIKDQAQAGAILKLAAVMAAWADRAKKWLNEKTLEDEHFCPTGYIRVTSTRRIVEDVQKLISIAKRFIAPEKVDALVEISLTPLEKEIALATERGKKESTVAEFGKLLLETGAVKMGSPFAFLRVSKNGSNKENT